MSGPSSTRCLFVAVVGSGPSAMFTVEALLESGADVRVAVIERLPVPFGLVRYGVAPDHHATKRVSDAMGAVLADPRVSFYGNVEVGSDVRLPELRELFDSVVLATGASKDARLGIEGEDLRHAVGSSALVGWYNGHPDHARLAPNLAGPNAVIIGMGNVALDIARILAKPAHQLVETDIAGHALAALVVSDIRDIFIIGRGGPLNAKFSYPELREMTSLQDVVPLTDPLRFPSTAPEGATKPQKRIFDLFAAFAANAPNAVRKRVHFVFDARPVEIFGKEAVESIIIEEGVSGQTRTREIPTGLIVKAIGYRSVPVPDIAFDDGRMVVPNVGGLVDDGVYAVGWVGRGPSGVIGTNKPDAYRVASSIVCAGSSPQDSRGHDGLEEVLRTRAISWVSRESWLKIDAAERSSGASRTKLVNVRDMLEAAGLKGPSGAKGGGETA